MCWMTVRQESDALRNGLAAVRYGEQFAGGHSWGYAYAKDGGIHTAHGLGMIPDIPVPEVDNALVHTRFSTRGLINLSNSHPFEIHKDGKTIGAFAHNGTWYDADPDKYVSDTYQMAELFQSYVDESDFETGFIKTAEETGETLVGIDTSGVGYVHAGRFTITRNGSVVESSRHNKIQNGKILRMENGDVEVIKELHDKKPKRTIRSRIYYAADKMWQWPDQY